MSAEAVLAWFTIWLIAGLFAMSVAIAAAHVKHRAWLLWGVASLFLPPLVLWLLLLPRRPGPASFEKESDSWFDSHGRDKHGWW